MCVTKGLPVRAKLIPPRRPNIIIGNLQPSLCWVLGVLAGVKQTKLLLQFDFKLGSFLPNIISVDTIWEIGRGGGYYE